MMAKEISQQLAQRAEEIARYLLPNGKKEGNEWRVGSVNGEVGTSLGVHLSGDKAGIWSDFATGGSEAGDLLDLWVQTRRLTISEALKEATHFLGITIPRFEAYRSPSFTKPLISNNSEMPLSSPVMRYLVDERKLLVETVKAYKIRERHHEIIFPYWRDNELVFIKYLNLERSNGKKITVGKNCEPCLFGWHLIPSQARSITITEGEIDAMTLHQYGIAALSVPFGGGAGNKHKWVEHEFDRLAVFDEIYLCLDNDKEGLIATMELIERLGRHRCRIVRLPCKDANDCLKQGVTQAVIEQCFHDAKTCDPDELKSAYQFVGEVIENFYPLVGTIIGYQPPWDKAKSKILFRPSELSVWTGINGHGKSQFLGHVILDAMKQGARVCIASLELKPSRLLMRLTRQAGALEAPSIEYIHAIHQWYEDKLWLFDLVGTAKSKRLLEVFLYARQRYGIDIFVIDSFMKLDIAEDDYKAQKAFIEQLCDFKNQHNCHIHIVVHPRKSSDELNPPGKLDNKGSGAISDLADNCFSVWRDKERERVIQKQTSGKELTLKEREKLNYPACLWSCDKQRNGDWEGRLGFWFDKPTFQYLGNANQKPVRIVEYSICSL